MGYLIMFVFMLFPMLFMARICFELNDPSLKNERILERINRAGPGGCLALLYLSGLISVLVLAFRSGFK